MVEELEVFLLVVVGGLHFLYLVLDVSLHVCNLLRFHVLGVVQVQLQYLHLIYVEAVVGKRELVHVCLVSLCGILTKVQRFPLRLPVVALIRRFWQICF